MAHSPATIGNDTSSQKLENLYMFSPATMYKPDWQYDLMITFFLFLPFLHLYVTTKKQLNILKVIRSGQTFRSEGHKDRASRCRLWLGPARLRAARGLLLNSRQGLPTRWACRPRQQPPVDAPDMEAMVAFGEDPDMLPCLKV
jgi:hypothetical protein